MNELEQDRSLLMYNSFGMDVKARWFGRFSALAELEELTALAPGAVKEPPLILGGGSNILFTKDVNGLVFKNEIRGISELAEDPDYVYIKAGAGENWHQFVQYCVSRGWAGVENLSLIPGNVGATPMQNIGAYGVEIQDVFSHLEAYHIHDRQVHTFTRSDCAFGYRDSVFKQKYKGQFVILHVVFRLRKRPVFHTSYGAIQQELEKMGVTELTIDAVSKAVIHIRSSKLPDPHSIGNAGSFFKNPSVSRERYEVLLQRFPRIVGHDNPDGTVKLAAGWLIEQCGWKGYRKGDAGVHALQALVLVNYGRATGEEIYNLSKEIQASVQETFGVELEREVNII